MLNIVIPMAGLGSRLKTAGGTLPKPMLELWSGKRIVQMVLDYLKPGQAHRIIFVCQKEHRKRLRLDDFFRSTGRRFEVAVADGLTEGPACTVLLAEKWINNREELLVAYCDDYLHVRLKHFLARFRKLRSDGGMMLYRSENPNNSYAITRNGTVLRTAEKRRISWWATAGLYYFREGRDFVQAARGMIGKNRRVRNEFFVCPVYNEMIRAGKKITGLRFPSSANFGMGTPAELERFLKVFGPKKNTASG